MTPEEAAEAFLVGPQHPQYDAACRLLGIPTLTERFAEELGGFIREELARPSIIKALFPATPVDPND